MTDMVDTLNKITEKLEKMSDDELTQDLMDKKIIVADGIMHNAIKNMQDSNFQIMLPGKLDDITDVEIEVDNDNSQTIVSGKLILKQNNYFTSRICASNLIGITPIESVNNKGVLKMKKGFRTLEGIKSINNFDILRADEIDLEENETTDDLILRVTKMMVEKQIHINDAENIISFRFQRGSVKDHGINGVQLDMLLTVALIMTKGLNKEKQHDCNDKAIKHITSAITELAHRKNEIATIYDIKR